MSYSKTFTLIAHDIDTMMSVFSHTKKDLSYGYRWTFTNRQRVDLIDYTKQGKTIFRVGRGAWLVKQFPLLYNRFDEVGKVIAKLSVTDPSLLEQKHFADLLKVIHDAPHGIGAFD